MMQTMHWRYSTLDLGKIFCVMCVGTRHSSSNNWKSESKIYCNNSGISYYWVRSFKAQCPKCWLKDAVFTTAISTKVADMKSIFCILLGYIALK